MRNTRKQQKRFTLKISAHFSKRDFVCKCGKCDQAIRVSMGLVGGLELLRAKVQNRITVVRGYMCADAVEAERGLRRNYYTVGVAADITVENMDPKAVFVLAEEVPEFKGLGLNLDTGVLHVDTRKEKDRVIWVETHGQVVTLTESNRHDYFGHPETLAPQLS
jgi:hypothetical protein